MLSAHHNNHFGVKSSHIDALGLASVSRAYVLSLVQPLVSQHIPAAPVQAYRK